MKPSTQQFSFDIDGAPIRVDIRGIHILTSIGLIFCPDEAGQTLVDAYEEYRIRFRRLLQRESLMSLADTIFEILNSGMEIELYPTVAGNISIEVSKIVAGYKYQFRYVIDRHFGYENRRYREQLLVQGIQVAFTEIGKLEHAIISHRAAEGSCL